MLLLVLQNLCKMATKVSLVGDNVIIDQYSTALLTIRQDRAIYYLLIPAKSEGNETQLVKNIEFFDTTLLFNRVARIEDIQDGAGNPFADFPSLLKYLDTVFNKASAKVFSSEDVSVDFQDSPALDSFGRLRTSGTGQRLDVEFIYDKQEEVFDEIIVGAGTVVHQGNSRDLILAPNSVVNADSAGMSSYPVPYTPGNSQLIAITGTLNEANIAGGTVEVFVRSKVTGAVVEDVYLQEKWSENIMSSIGWENSVIFEVDFQSLKVGRIRYCLNIAGITTPMHIVENDNIRNTGYWQSPSLPAYWRCYNDATHTYCEMGYGDENNGIGIRYKLVVNAAAQLRGICCTVKSEGGQNIEDIKGYYRKADVGTTKVVVGNTLIPIISIRPKSTFKTFPNLGLTIPIAIKISTDNPIRLVVIHNATLTAPTWVDVDTAESHTEYDVSASGYTNGHEIDSDYPSTGKNLAASANALLDETLLWNRRGVETGIFTICAVRATTTNADVYISLKFREIR